MDGFLNILKPPGISSGSVVGYVRHRLPRGTAVGHGGTLDPEAAGVLPLCVGRATRLFDYIIDKEKEYIAEVRLGIETDTQDATGEIVARAERLAVTEQDFLEVLPRFVGEIDQVPPAFSAIISMVVMAGPPPFARPFMRCVRFRERARSRCKKKSETFSP